MSNSILTEISCPNCLAPIGLEGHGSSITCGACNSQYLLQGHLCSSCSTYYKDEVAVCGRCGTAMLRHCHKCHTDNWAGDEYCKSCGTAMDLLDMAVKSHHEQTAEHQAQRMSQIRDIRAQGEVSSQKRMDELRQVDHQRRAKLQERQAQKRQRDTITFLIIGLIVVIAFIALLWFIFV